MMDNKMLPINGASKAKRIAWGPAQNPLSWSYMKLLRENNKTRKVYDVNPYIEVYQFRDNLYGLFNQNCDGMGDVWQFLIVGPQKALLVDTACGLGDMKGLCDQITGGKPLIVVNTHEHPDHAYGNCRFGKVYCHETAVPYLKMQSGKMWDKLFDADGKNRWLQFDRKDLPEFKPYEIVPVKDGHVFNLGGDYEVEAVFTGGHSACHTMYLDKKGRTLFCGDDVCSDVSGCGNGTTPDKPFAEFANLTTYRDNLIRLSKRFDEFDYLFPCHFMVNLENRLLLDFIDALNIIIDNPDHYTYNMVTSSGNGNPPVDRRYRYVPGFSTIAYTKNGVNPLKK